MKKLISVLVAAVMICSLAVVPAFATETEETAPAAACPARGDVDNDGTISAEDARLALRQSVSLENLDAEALIRADVDGDDAISAEDARLALRLSVGLEKAPAHVFEEKAADATWTTNGGEWTECEACHEKNYTLKEDTKLHTIVEAANNWANNNGAAQFIEAADTNGETNEVVVTLKVDGIWEDVALEGGIFDGFLTKLGNIIDGALTDEDTVTIDGKAVYADGKIQNTAVKNALFDIGAGFFYKMANLADDGVFGTYAVAINDEEIALTVEFAGSEANIAKIKSFCGTIADHISATVVDGNLVIDVYAPDALKNVIIEKAGEDAKTALDALTLAKGIAIVEGLDTDEVFGSQGSAINKLCAFVCELAPLANKVLSKTEAEVELADGTKVALLSGNDFDCNSDNSFSGVVTGLKALLSEELLGKTVGAFAVEGEEYYSVKVNAAVDMSSLGLMAGEVIEETVIINIHVFDN